MHCVKESIFCNDSTKKSAIAKMNIGIFNFEKMRTILLPPVSQKYFNLQHWLEIRVPSWSTLLIKIQ